jgi:hypothetical protein
VGARTLWVTVVPPLGLISSVAGSPSGIVGVGVTGDALL